MIRENKANLTRVNSSGILTFRRICNVEVSGLRVLGEQQANLNRVNSQESIGLSLPSNVERGRRVIGEGNLNY